MTRLGTAVSAVGVGFPAALAQAGEWPEPEYRSLWSALPDRLRQRLDSSGWPQGEPSRLISGLPVRADSRS